jgi:hypothetical protein
LCAFAASCLTGDNHHLVVLNGLYDVIPMGGDRKVLRIGNVGFLGLSPFQLLKRSLQPFFQNREVAKKPLGPMTFVKGLLQTPGKKNPILQHDERKAGSDVVNALCYEHILCDRSW